MHQRVDGCGGARKKGLPAAGHDSPRLGDAALEVEQKEIGLAGGPGHLGGERRLRRGVPQRLRDPRPSIVSPARPSLMPPRRSPTAGPGYLRPSDTGTSACDDGHTTRFARPDHWTTSISWAS